MLIDYQLTQTSVVLRVKLRQDTTGAKPGNGITGLTSASTGLSISTIADNEAAPTAYTSAGSTIENIATLGTYAAPTATKCRFKEVSSTSNPGVYELQIADARFAVSSAKSLLVSITGVSGMSDCDVCIPLRSVNPYDGTRGGMTALPNVASGSAGAIPTTGTGANQIAVNGSGGVSHVVLTDTTTTLTNLPSIPAGWLTATGIAAAALNGKGDWNVGKTGYTLTQAFPSNFAALLIGATGHITTVDTVITTTTATNLTNAPTAGDFTSTMKTSLNAATPASVSGAVGSVTGNVGGNVTGSVGSLATQAKTDVENAVWNAVEASHLTSGSTGAALNAAGSAGDPWATSLPGSYGAGTAGNIVGTNLNATVGSRLATTGYTAPDNTGIGSIVAKLPTNNIADETLVINATNAIIAAVGTPIQSGASVVLATAQPNYAPAKAGDAMTLTSAYDAAKTAAQAGDQMDLINAPNATAITAIQSGLSKPGTPQTVDLTTAVPTSNTAQTVGDALNAARAQGFGKWAISGTTLTLYASDGTTAVRTFALDSSTAPTSRT